MTCAKLWVWLGRASSPSDRFDLVKLVKSHHPPDSELRWIYQGAEDPCFFFSYFRVWNEIKDA